MIKEFLNREHKYTNRYMIIWGVIQGLIAIAVYTLSH